MAPAESAPRRSSAGAPRTVHGLADNESRGGEGNGTASSRAVSLLEASGGNQAAASVHGPLRTEEPGPRDRHDHLRRRSDARPMGRASARQAGDLPVRHERREFGGKAPDCLLAFIWPVPATGGSRCRIGGMGKVSHRAAGHHDGVFLRAQPARVADGRMRHGRLHGQVRGHLPGLRRRPEPELRPGAARASEAPRAALRASQRRGGAR